MPVIEICIDSVAGVRAALAAGAARVELCAGLIEGGTTPSPGLLKTAVAAAAGRLKVHAMVRPRGGDFLYDADEFAAMEADVNAAREAGADGVVFGLLTPEGAIDADRTAALLALARPLSVTFHRAFDVSRDPFEGLDTLMRLGIDRLLTSGQEPSVLQGAPLIRRLIAAAGDRLVVMPGGDVTERNVARILAETGAGEIHFAAFERQVSAMHWRNESIPMGGALHPPEFDRPVTTAQAISRVATAAQVGPGAI